MKAKILTRQKNPGAPNPGAILTGRLLFTGLMQPNTFQCTEGKHMGEIFQPHEFEAVKEEAPKGLNALEERNKELEGERIIHLNKINRLDEALEEARADEKRAVANADRLHDNIVNLSGECRRLERELEAARDAKKVVLPREVAEAIAVCKQYEMSEYGILCNINTIPQHFRDFPENVLNALKKIRSFTHEITRAETEETGTEVLLEALVNGYTVEEPADEESTIEDILKDRFLSMFAHYNVAAGISHESLTSVLLFNIRDVLADDRSEQEMQ